MISEEQRQALLQKRAELERQITELASTPVGRSQAAARFRAEDLTKLAKKITAIDKKLGRS